MTGSEMSRLKIGFPVTTHFKVSTMESNPVTRFVVRSRQLTRVNNWTNKPVAGGGGWERLLGCLNKIQVVIWFAIQFFFQAFDKCFDLPLNLLWCRDD